MNVTKKFVEKFPELCSKCGYCRGKGFLTQADRRIVAADEPLEVTCTLCGGTGLAPSPPKMMAYIWERG